MLLEGVLIQTLSMLSWLGFLEELHLKRWENKLNKKRQNGTQVNW